MSMSAQNLTDAQKAAAEAAAAMESAPTEKVKVKKPTNWALALKTQITIGQTSLTNWAAGGDNSASLQAFIDANANYKKDLMFWNNRLQLDYGFLYASSKPILQKNNDRIYLESQWGYTANKIKSMSFSANYNFRSQFSNTYEYPVPSAPEDAEADWEPTRKDWKNARKLKSGCASPAYTNLALGIDYKPFKWLSMSLAPLTGGFVIVSNKELRKSYGMLLKKVFEDRAPEELPTDGSQYKNSRFEFGAQFKADIKLNVNDNFSYSTQLVLFSNYLDKPQNIRVNWDNRIDWKLAKYFSFTIVTNLIYDDKVMIKNEKDIDKYPNGIQRVQFKESLSFGFTYTLANKK